MVCTLAKTLCFTQLFVFSWPSTVLFFSFPFVFHCYVCHVFILYIVTALPVPGWKRCLSFFYCIILPFDLVMLNRMSYNVESAKSVLFSKVCNLLWNVKDFLCNTHITKTTKMLYILSTVGATVNLTVTMCCDNIMTRPLWVSRRCYVVLGWHILLVFFMCLFLLSMFF